MRFQYDVQGRNVSSRSSQLDCFCHLLCRLGFERGIDGVGWRAWFDEMVKHKVIPASAPSDWMPPGVSMHAISEHGRMFATFYVDLDQTETFLAWAVSVGLPQETAERMLVLVTLEMAEG